MNFPGITTDGITQATFSGQASPGNTLDVSLLGANGSSTGNVRAYITQNGQVKQIYSSGDFNHTFRRPVSYEVKLVGENSFDEVSRLELSGPVDFPTLSLKKLGLNVFKLTGEASGLSDADTFNGTEEVIRVKNTSAGVRTQDVPKSTRRLFVYDSSTQGDISDLDTSNLVQFSAGNCDIDGTIASGDSYLSDNLDIWGSDSTSIVVDFTVMGQEAQYMTWMGKANAKGSMRAYLAGNRDCVICKTGSIAPDLSGSLGDGDLDLSKYRGTYGEPVVPSSIEELFFTMSKTPTNFSFISGKSVDIRNGSRYASYGPDPRTTNLDDTFEGIQTADQNVDTSLLTLINGVGADSRPQDHSNEFPATARIYWNTVNNTDAAFGWTGVEAPAEILGWRSDAAADGSTNTITIDVDPLGGDHITKTNSGDPTDPIKWAHMYIAEPSYTKSGTPESGYVKLDPLKSDDTYGNHQYLDGDSRGNEVYVVKVNPNVSLSSYTAESSTDSVQHPAYDLLGPNKNYYDPSPTNY